MEALVWLFLPVFVAGGSALLSYYMMQARMEVSLAKERESLAEARAVIDSHKSTVEQRVKAVREETRRATLDEVMKDFHIEERSYMRDSANGDSSTKTMVMQERMFFRNIPLSNWTEREMVVEENNVAAALPRPEPSAILFPLPVQTADGRLAISKQIGGGQIRGGQETGPEKAPAKSESKPDGRSEERFLPHPKFAAQRDIASALASAGHEGPYSLPTPQSMAALQAAVGNGLQPNGLHVVKSQPNGFRPQDDPAADDLDVDIEFDEDSEAPTVTAAFGAQ